MIDDTEINTNIVAAAVKSQLGNYDSDTPDVIPRDYNPEQMTDMEVIQAMGKDKGELKSPTFGAEAAAYRAGVGRDYARRVKFAEDQAKAEQARQVLESDPSYIAQQVYGRSGNIAAARTIEKSRGTALFNHGDLVEMGREGTYAITPAGDFTVSDANGKRTRLSMSEYINYYGVKVVPFLGGDEAAEGWRGAAAKTSELMEVLDTIEDLYNEPGFISIPGTDKNRQLEQLESGLVNIVIQLKTGSKSMAGVSDREMANLLNGLPSAGTNFWMSTGTGLERVKKTREQVSGVLRRMALMNGLALVKLKPQPSAAGSPTGQQKTLPGMTNGK